MLYHEKYFLDNIDVSNINKIFLSKMISRKVITVIFNNLFCKQKLILYNTIIKISEPISVIPSMKITIVFL